MRKKLYVLWQEAVIFYLGGMFYCGVELLWRGWTHGSMFLLGAVCFYLVGSLDRRWHLPVLWQMVLGALIVTFCEFWTGVLVNEVMHLSVWDYSDAPLNFRGQICPQYFCGWLGIALLAVFLDDGVRYLAFGEAIGPYCLF